MFHLFSSIWICIRNPSYNFIHKMCIRDSPSPIPGTEFQLSAPLAISIGRIRGFLHYLTIGIIASIIGMILGLQTIYNVIIAMVYRIVAGLILTVLKKDPLALIIAGPAGTFAARLVLATILDAVSYTHLDSSEHLQIHLYNCILHLCHSFLQSYTYFPLLHWMDL